MFWIRTFLLAGIRRVRATWPVEMAEGKALFMAIRLALKFGYTDIILESDSQVIILRLSKAMIYFADLDSMLEDIVLLSSDFDYLAWSHVKRDGNFVAHHLARLVSFGIEQSWINYCPA